MPTIRSPNWEMLSPPVISFYSGRFCSARLVCSLECNCDHGGACFGCLCLDLVLPHLNWVLNSNTIGRSIVFESIESGFSQLLNSHAWMLWTNTGPTNPLHWRVWIYSEMLANICSKLLAFKRFQKNSIILIACCPSKACYSGMITRAFYSLMQICGIMLNFSR